SLERAVKNAKLDVFERFVNEAWTSERLRVLILERVLSDLPPLFEGTNRGKAPMEALDSLIQRSADAVYRRIFETSELLAANTSTSLCSDWLENQFGSEKGELKSQKPIPMRVIWSATGPKDDPSMYGRVTF